jgi:nucleotide-binding universal stress UspA family protein
MYRHILVPTDGTLVSARAEKVAVDMAKKFGARITVAHVVPPWSPHHPSKPEYEKAAGDRGKAAARRVMTRARRAKVKADAVVEIDDSPGDVLVRLARNQGCDLIVMASNSRVGLERILLGSVTSEVLTGTKTPVLVCH